MATTETPEVAVVEPFMDLIYADDEAAQWFKATWPEAVIEDASDFVHDQRFQVTIPGVTEDDVFPKVIAEGFALVSLGLGICLRIDKRRDDCKRWLDEAKQIVATERAGLTNIEGDGIDCQKGTP